MKKEKFKKLVNEKIRNLSDDYLLNLQQVEQNLHNREYKKLFNL